MSKKTLSAMASIALALFALWALRFVDDRPAQPTPSNASPRSTEVPPRSSQKRTPKSSTPPARSAAKTLEGLFAAKRSGVWVEVSAPIQSILPDDNDGSRHQRFILRVSPTLTVLVAHNLDAAKRVPARVGDVIQLRGRY